MPLVTDAGYACQKILGSEMRFQEGAEHRRDVNTRMSPSWGGVKLRG